MGVLAVGLTTVDLVHGVTVPPGPDEKVVADRQELAAGGPAAGAAVTAAALGEPVTLLTALGTHPLATFAAAELTGRGVTVVDATPDAVDAPAVSAVTVAADGRRSVVSVNATASAATPPAELDALVAAAAVVLVDGHHPALALAAASAARRSGRPVLLDGGSWKPVLAELLPLVDVAACSAAFRLPGADSAAGSVSALASRYGVPVAALTAGPEPVRWWRGAEAGSVPVPAVVARDTLGAGDAFHGALAVALARSGPSAVDWVAALRFAAGVASRRCATVGARAWLEGLDDGVR